MPEKRRRKAGVWRQRFRRGVDPFVLKFTSSAGEDERLIPYDLAASRAHVRMLGRQKILSPRERSRLLWGLKKIGEEYGKGMFRLRTESEDVHVNIEERLQEIVGPAGRKLHTARSRNDLVATDLRLYAREAIFSTLRLIGDLQKEILRNARENFTVVIPGYTHLQQAQPVLWPFYWLSHFTRLQRDVEGLQEALKRVEVSPLGGCALAGTSLPTDPGATAALLGFPLFSMNAMDAVSDRDFLCEVSFRWAQILLHLATLAEDMILFSTEEFGLLEVDDRVATGSSIMPQKKNLDVCELLRAKSGKAVGRLVSLLTILKGLPSSYNRDLQEMKGIFFRQAEETRLCLEAARIVAASVRPQKTDWPSRENFICATNLAEGLVRKGHAFRQAYDVIAECVRASRGDVEDFIRLCSGKLKTEQAAIRKKLKPENAVRDMASPAGTSPRQTRISMSRAQRMIRRNEIFCLRFSPAPEARYCRCPPRPRR